MVQQALDGSPKAWLNRQKSKRVQVTPDEILQIEIYVGFTHREKKKESVHTSDDSFNGGFSNVILNSGNILLKSGN